ncbi:MAG TPA: DUF2953 domain-containing protein [Methanoregulaceae archaeon]|nr:DUF2953 domain-containing protein [Methanoregulaceae archaeon]HQJ88806.1 DUF2953 domain-containing protein [Methanoregulaceae archaeon]
MPVLLTLAVLFLVLLLVALLYLALVPIVATVRSVPRRASAEVTWGLIGARFRQEDGQRRLEVCLPCIAIPLPVPGEEEGEKVGSDTGPAAGAPPEEQAGRPEADLGRALRVLGLLFRVRPAVQRLVIAALRQTRLRLCLDLAVGTGDAGTTGETVGLLMALRGALSAQPWFCLNATPVFDGPCLEWDAKGEVRVRSPIRVLVPALLLALRPEVRALVREARR